MKKFVLEEILLMSQSERTARKIKFHPKTTVILGANDTGKSSLVKSIYWTFGAEPAVIHPEWKKLDIVSLVRFSVDGKRYSILRQGNFFALFDNVNNLISKYSSVTKELGPELAKIFSFNIKLLGHDGSEITPPPAYYLLPFYVDQDKSWTDSWAGFTKLLQIPRWRSPMIDYHVGFKDNDDYLLKSEKDQINLIVQSLNSERSIYEKALIEIKKDESEVDFDLDINTYKKEVEELLETSQRLNILESKLKSNLVTLFNDRSAITHQIDVVNSTLAEVKGDYDYALNHVDVECPTCGQHYTNSFAERFSIAKDEYRCNELLSELHLSLIELNKKIDLKQNEYDSNHEYSIAMENLLAKKKGLLSLGEIIHGEGKKQMKKFLKDKLNAIDYKLQDFIAEIKRIEKDQKNKAKSEKERKALIQNTYLFKMKEYLEILNVSKLTVDSYYDIKFIISETGSDRPRALLAYYFVVLNLIKEFSSAVFAPIIIDSPKQQDPDIDNWKKILNFIKDKQIEDSQLILTLSDLGNTNFGGKVIELSEKHKLLLKEEYGEIFNEINPFFNKSLLS